MKDGLVVVLRGMEIGLEFRGTLPMKLVRLAAAETVYQLFFKLWKSLDFNNNK